MHAYDQATHGMHVCTCVSHTISRGDSLFIIRFTSTNTFSFQHASACDWDQLIYLDSKMYFDSKLQSTECSFLL